MNPVTTNSTCTLSKCLRTLAGTVLVVAAAWFYLAYERHMVWPGLCPGVNMNIEGGVVRAAQIEGDHLAITADFPEQHIAKVILYDYCSGRVLSSVVSSK